jgi:ATP-binding protein involved in chromosome partitioning
MSDQVPDRKAVEAALAEFPDPETGRNIWQLEQVHNLALSGHRIALSLGLTSFAAPVWQETCAALEAHLRRRFPDVSEVAIERVDHHRPPDRLGQIGLTAKSVIAVGSGKGGVGKSTIAACLAFGLQRAGCHVGLMDADVYGPSIPHLLGLPLERPMVEDQKILPIVTGGMPVMSMGFLVPPGEAVVWRGPMLHGAITQFLRDTKWGPLDYLIIDMPPGTGDVALTLSQAIPLTGAIVVCTPQDVALLDAVKAIAMFRKVNIPVLGMVENMSGFVCPECHTRYDIFGSGGARARAAELDIPFLGEVPIQIPIRVLGDTGRTASNFDDPQTAPYFQALCHNLVRYLTQQAARRPPQPQLPVLG